MRDPVSNKNKQNNPNFSAVQLELEMCFLLSRADLLNSSTQQENEVSPGDRFGDWFD